MTPVSENKSAEERNAVNSTPTAVTEPISKATKAFGEPLEVTAVKRAMAQGKGSPTTVSDTWDVDGAWSPTETPASGTDISIPTPPTTNAPPSVNAGSLPTETRDIEGDGANAPQMDVSGVKSKLSVAGGHEQCGHGGHNPGHVWPSQISPSVSRRPSRPQSPTLVGGEDKAADAAAVGISHLGIDTESARANIDNKFPIRSNPRNGSPVYLSPGDFAASFEMHSMAGESASAVAASQGTSEPQDSMPPSMSVRSQNTASPAHSEPLPGR
ncbi:hypothetical protein GGI23_005710, partial [Coemansia sp. RSA 2559]